MRSKERKKKQYWNIQERMRKCQEQHKDTRETRWNWTSSTKKKENVSSMEK